MNNNSQLSHSLYHCIMVKYHMKTILLQPLESLIFTDSSTPLFRSITPSITFLFHVQRFSFPKKSFQIPTLNSQQPIVDKWKKIISRSI